jgi:L-fuconolactonase
MIQDIPDTQWMLRPSLEPALEAMIEHDLVFDALVKPPHLPALLEFARRHPALTIVLDHGGKPPIASGDLVAWQRDVARLARDTALVCKLSGLVTEAGSAQPQALAASVNHLLDHFGAGRLLWGSDWPVCELVCSYQNWLEACDQLLQPLGAAERQLIQMDNARAIYGI